MSDWVRRSGVAPEKRHLILRYKPGDPQYALIEELLKEIPHSKISKTLLQCIVLAAPNMLQALRENQPPAELLAPIVQPGAKAADPSAPPAEAGFSQAAVKMFDD